MRYRERSLIGSRRPFQWLFRLEPAPSLVVCFESVLVLAVIDVATPPEFELSFAYALVILLATWNIGPATGIAFAALASAIQFIELHQLTVLPLVGTAWLLPLLGRVCIFGTVVVLTSASRQLLADRMDGPRTRGRDGLEPRSHRTLAERNAIPVREQD